MLNTIAKENLTGSQAFWDKQISSYQQSSLSRKDFCEQNGLSYSKFCYWCRKLTQKASGSALDGIQFLQVDPAELYKDSPPDIAAVITLGSLRIEITSRASPQLVSQILRELAS